MSARQTRCIVYAAFIDKLPLIKQRASREKYNFRLSRGTTWKVWTFWKATNSKRLQSIYLNFKYVDVGSVVLKQGKVVFGNVGEMITENNIKTKYG